MWVAMQFEEFKFEGINFKLPIEVIGNKAVGYLPVYASVADAREDYPDAELMPIHVKERAKKFTRGIDK